MARACSRSHEQPTSKGESTIVKQLRPGPSRASAGSLLVVLVLVLAAACTGDSGRPDETLPTRPPTRSVEPTPTLEPQPVELDVAVAKVLGGKLSPRRSRELETQVGRVVGRYLEAAYLGGEYPRRDFSEALVGFSRGAAGRAVSDREILSNAAAGATTVSVVPRAEVARLDVLLANRRLIAGLTARIRLVFVQESATGADQRVTVSGRLLLNRKRTGAWQIFGYDVSRSATPVGTGGDR